jgi:hypothetical protein
MRLSCRLGAVTGAFQLVALIACSASAAAQQTPAASASPPGDINPPVANCNLTPDTNAGAKPPPPKVVATPVTAELLTSGQPCHQVVSTAGLVANDPLANLQRGFDFYSWLTFIALNAPADGKRIGQGPRPGGDATTKWEDLASYRPLADVMLAHGAAPTWGTRIVPETCKSLDGPGKIILTLGEEAFNQPFKSGPLIDQDGNYALFDILMNRPMFDYILENKLYSVPGQASFSEVIAFPEGNNPAGADPGRMGAVMVKVSWRILDPARDRDLISQFHTADALIFFPGPPATKTGPTCVEKKLGLVGFHVGHKTKFAPQWVWSSFEHVSNAPDQADVASRKLLTRYNFFNPACKTCAVNDTPQAPPPWDPDASLKFHTGYRSQVTRVNMLPPPVIAEVAELNRQFRAVLKGTVWEHYMLLATQWPTDFKSLTDPTGRPAPTYLANTTLETYSQGRVPLASSSCMACHNNATTRHVPAQSSDFTFILEKAQ